MINSDMLDGDFNWDDGSPPPENMFFTDDAVMITDMLKKSWSLGPEDTPVISFSMEGMMVDARKAYIYVYLVSRYNSISATDYGTLQRTSFVDLRISTRSRNKLYQYAQEVYRIVYANRRLGWDKLNGYTWWEITNDRVDNSAQGWYSVLFSTKLVSYCYPVISPGFGDQINSMFIPQAPANNDNDGDDFDQVEFEY